MGECSEVSMLRMRMYTSVSPRLYFTIQQYESEIIAGVIEGLITCETFGYEDYPCEMTMIRWKAHKSQLLL
mgnify:CR=1 FL=1